MTIEMTVSEVLMLPQSMFLIGMLFGIFLAKFHA
jgi:hypothetical protein